MVKDCAKVRKLADKLGLRLSLHVSVRNVDKEAVTAFVSVRRLPAVKPLDATSVKTFVAVTNWEFGRIESVALPSDKIHTTKKGKTTFGVYVRLQSGTEWVVHKRYSDFRRLHEKLKSKAAIEDQVRRLQFPRKHWVFNGSATVIRERRQMLEAYARQLLTIYPTPCVELSDFFQVKTGIEAYRRNLRRVARTTIGHQVKTPAVEACDKNEYSPNTASTEAQDTRLVSRSYKCSSHEFPATVDSCDDRVHDSADAYAESLALIDTGTLLELCQPMHELRDISENFVERLSRTRSCLSELQHAVPAEIASEFARLIKRFQEFQVQHQKRSTIQRLDGTGALVDVLYGFNCDADALEVKITTTCSGGISRLTTWKKTWDDAVRDVEKSLASTRKANIVQLREELPSGETQHNVTMLLNNKTTWHELEHSSSSHNLLESVTNVVGSFLTAQGEAVPERFIPEHEIQRESQPFSRGFFGTVYRGKWRDASVVIKYVNVDKMSAFLREDRIWHMARHPHVVTYYGACHLSKPCFFVSEEAVNGNVADYLPRAKRDGRVLVWRMIHGAALGLHFLHQNGIVHGDLKCNNLLVDADEMVKLTDFGMSFVVGSDPVACGSPARWTAPECLIKKQAPSFQSDLYSFGMCIVEAVTDKVPWGSRADVVLIDELEHNQFLPKLDGFEDAQWELVLSLCAFEPHDRLDLSDVIVQLKKFADAETASERARK